VFVCAGNNVLIVEAQWIVIRTIETGTSYHSSVKMEWQPKCSFIVSQMWETTPAFHMILAVTVTWI
jgi:hypothetical protein